ncbi:MAG: glycosyltransferase [Spirochaetaceae bacterium]
MKEVTILTSKFPNLTETFILNQVIGLMDEGIKVNTISLHKTDLTNAHPDFNSYNCVDFLSVIGIPSNKIKRVLKSILIFIKLMFICPGKTLKAIDKKYTTASKSLKNLYILNSYRNKNIDVLQAHFGPNGIIGAFLKDVGIVKKLVVTFHGSDINSYPKRHGENVYKTLYKNADVISTNTQFTADKVIKNGVVPKKIQIIPVGLLCKNFPVRVDPGDTTNKKILTVGRLVEKKGHIWMIKAMKDILKSYPNTIWNIVGSGPLEESLKNRVKENNLEKNIIFLGALKSPDVIKNLKESHIFVLPSVTASSGDMEGQGLVLQEAQSMAVPVVSTLHNGIPDGVLDGKSGYLVPEKDDKSLAQAIIKLLADDDLRSSMGKTGAKFVRENYDISILSKKWLDIFNSI